MGNGLGPAYFPASWRRVLTKVSASFFEEASWDKHDEGYGRGNPVRSECDRLFFMAMLRDATLVNSVGRVWACIWLAGFFWLMVRLFGWASYKNSRCRKKE